MKRARCIDSTHLLTYLVSSGNLWDDGCFQVEVNCFDVLTNYNYIMSVNHFGVRMNDSYLCIPRLPILLRFVPCWICLCIV